VFSIYLLLDTGIRFNELLNIKTKNVDITSRKILLDETKNGKKRMVSYGVLTESLIARIYNKKHVYLLWNSIQNMPLQRRSLEHFFDKMNQKLKLSQNVHAHRLRKTFATRLLKMGCPLTTIQKLLGHKSITQTMIYLEIDNEMIDKDYRAFYPY
jgi:site-specific recombinase XerD